MIKEFDFVRWYELGIILKLYLKLIEWVVYKWLSGYCRHHRFSFVIWEVERTVKWRPLAATLALLLSLVPVRLASEVDVELLLGFVRPPLPKSPKGWTQKVPSVGGVFKRFFEVLWKFKENTNPSSCRRLPGRSWVPKPRKFRLPRPRLRLFPEDPPEWPRAPNPTPTGAAVVVESPMIQMSSSNTTRIWAVCPGLRYAKLMTAINIKTRVPPGLDP